MIEKSSLVGVGDGVRVNPGKEVVSGTKKLVSGGVLMEKDGVSTVVSVRMAVSLLEIENSLLGVGVRVNCGNEVVSDTMELLRTGVTSVSDIVRVSVKKNSLVIVGVGVKVNCGSVVVSDRVKLLNAGVSGVLIEGEEVSEKVISLLVIMKSSLVGEGVGVGVRVNSSEDVVSDMKKLVTTGVSSGILVEGVNTNVVSV